MGKKINVSLGEMICAGFELITYRQSIKSAEMLDTSKIDKFEKESRIRLFNSLEQRCKQEGISVKDVDWTGAGGSIKAYMGIMLNLKKEKHKALCKKITQECRKAEMDFNVFISASDHIAVQEYEKWRKKYSLVLNAAKILSEEITDDDYSETKVISEIACDFLNKVKSQAGEVISRIEFEKQQKVNAIKQIQPVECHMLDEQQINCIIDDSYNHLVIAGAGTGKTTTIIGKIKYLIKSGKCKTDEILLLSFTKLSAIEMQNRIKSEISADMDVFTFHKLGYDIIARVERKIPDVYGKSIQYFALENIKKQLADENYKKLMIEYFLFSPSKSVQEFDFKSKDEYDKYMETNPPVTIKHESVKSYCEMEIANFFFKNNIAYTYEKNYEFDVSDSEYSQYTPDFYLDDYDIYVEFFAVDRNGNVPSFFSGRHGKSARDTYIDGIKWKRETHEKYHTKFVEISYSDKQCGRLFENLQNKLEAFGVVFNPKSDEQLWNDICAENDTAILNISEVIGTVISHIKASGHTLEYIMQSAPFLKFTHILRLTEPVYREYSEMLKRENKIDFSDMIYRAAGYVSQKKFSHKYKYVLIDEYQDISKARYKLIAEMRKSSDFNLFCVGDDWQSIYRFSGSDVGYILNFEKYWGVSQISKIETTYRFDSRLIQITSQFIMQNPMQIHKELKSVTCSDSIPLGFIKAYNDKWLVKFMAERVEKLEKGSTVFFIGRYNTDKKIFDNSEFEYQKNNYITLPSRPDLSMKFITAHGSKGLQADYVFIINNKNKGMGFPSRVQDEPVIQLLLENSDMFPFAEERRLFYVAMTRAKKKVWLLIQQENSSIFANELNALYGRETEREDMRERFTCPECGGRLVKRTGPYGEFYGCSNYRKTGCRYTKKIEK